MTDRHADYLSAILAAGVLRHLGPVGAGFAIQQSPRELVRLCEFIADERVMRYLEVGLGGGGLITFLAAQFPQMTVCGMDLHAPARFPSNGALFVGNSQRREAAEWARARGPFDLVLIDAAHDFSGTAADWALYARLGRFVAVHDICGNRGCEGSRDFWDVISRTTTVEETIIDADVPVGIGILQGGPHG